MYEHMERDLRSKSSRNAELQRDLAETKAKLEETQRAKDVVLNTQRRLKRSEVYLMCT